MILFIPPWMDVPIWRLGLLQHCEGDCSKVRPVCILSYVAYFIAEHLGLIPPQWCPSKDGRDPDQFMRPAPHPNPDETDSSEDKLVADPLSDDVCTISFIHFVAHLSFYRRRTCGI